MIIYVDEKILLSDDIEEMEKLKKVLATKFEIKNLYLKQYFLGIMVARSKRRVNIFNLNYVYDILIKTGMLGCKLRNTLIKVDKKMAEGRKLVKIGKYHKLVGKQIYLSHTQPEIVFAISC